MIKLLEIRFSGWTATPRMPFVLSGNALCMHTPSYSLLLGLIGCCLGRLVHPSEVKIGFKYSYDRAAQDIETRQRLEFDGKRLKKHSKGTDAYTREFHVLPRLILWINRLDWKTFFENPIGTPTLGRSQDILTIHSVKEVEVIPVKKAKISGCMLPFTTNLQVGGQLVQLAESFKENEEVGAGRSPVRSKTFIVIPCVRNNNDASYESSDFIASSSGDEAEIIAENLYQTLGETTQSFYLHTLEHG